MNREPHTARSFRARDSATSAHKSHPLISRRSTREGTSNSPAADHRPLGRGAIPLFRQRIDPF